MRLALICRKSSICVLDQKFFVDLFIFYFDIYISTPFLKECKDFHPAKDGDGWVEQSSHALFFGVLQKVYNL